MHDVEDENGKSIRAGRWEDRGDYWHLVITSSDFAALAEEQAGPVAIATDTEDGITATATRYSDGSVDIRTEPAAVSPAPPETAASFIEDLERDVRNPARLRAESVAAWRSLESLLSRLQHQTAKLIAGLDEAAELARRNGANIHKLICTHCDGESGHYDCDTCASKGHFFARIESEEQP